MDRRSFLQGAAAGGATATGLAVSPPASGRDAPAWQAGSVQHLLPTVSDRELLLKASFTTALRTTPELSVNGQLVRGAMSDSAGEFWQFHARNLPADTVLRLQLHAGGQALCDAWSLRTFPAPEASPERVRVLLFTCAGGHEMHGFLPVAIRNRLLRRGLSFAPHAAIANGDHVYWDLRSPLTSKALGQSPQAREAAGLPNRAEPILGTTNEDFLKRSAGPQILPVYGNDFRSTPVFFIQDDHDYYENDDAYDTVVTFPPDHFMTQMARATQALYYPEFLPDPSRPAGLPGASANGRALPASESFGTLRYGRLLEMLLYSVRRSMTMAGPSAVFLEDTVEQWLMDRMAATEIAHVVQAPSNPPGWSAGKWGEWYPDVLGSDGKLTIDRAKPYWQSGWVRQHDRLLAGMSAMRGRVPLVMSGDLHASALGRITRTGDRDLSANPVVAVLTGTIGTSERGWPSGIRKVGPQPSRHLQMQEDVKPIEQHGFTIADFTPEGVTLQLFKWDRKTQPVEAIDTLEPFHVAELKRPARAAS